MWITDHLRNLQNNISNRKPFQMLILLNPDNQNEFYNLVQQAETPLHNHLEQRSMSKDSQKKLKKVFGEILDWILNKVPEISSEKFYLDDILAFQFKGNEARISSQGKIKFWGVPSTSLHSPTSHSGNSIGISETSYSSKESENDAKSTNWQGKEKTRKVAVPDFYVTSNRIGFNRLRIFIKFKKNCRNAELYLFVDENIDTTCDRLLSSPAVPLLLSNFRIMNNMNTDAGLIKCEDGHNGIDLGNIKSNSEIIIEVEYQVPKDALPLIPDLNIPLRAEVVCQIDKDQLKSNSNNIQSEKINV